MEKINAEKEYKDFRDVVLGALACTVGPISVLLLTSLLPCNNPPIKYPTKEEYVYQQTMQDQQIMHELYEPVGNGGALSIYSDMKEKGNLEFNISEMYRKMDKRYNEILGGK